MIVADVLYEIGGSFRPLLLVDADILRRSAFYQWNDSGLTARVIRGRKARTRKGLFDEAAAALQFQLYFGENWDAFDDCMTDFWDYKKSLGYVIAITEPDQILADEGLSELTTLVSILNNVAAEWADPAGRGGWQDGVPRPFHVVLWGSQAEIDAASPRWVAAGATLATLEQ